MIRFELARLRDAERLAVMSREFIEAGLGWSWTPRRILSAIKSPDNVVLLARRHGELAGFAAMFFGIDEGRLNLLAVQPSQRRRGIGTSLVQWLEESALTAGLSVIYLETRTTSRAAVRFYQSLGYRAVQTLPEYYQGREAALRMARDLWDQPAHSDSDR